MSQWTMPVPPRRSRRRSRVAVYLSQAAVLTGLALVIGAVGATMKALVASDDGPVGTSQLVLKELEELQRSHDALKGRLEVAELGLERTHAIIDYSTQYRIPGDVSSAIYDAAIAEGIHPDVGFQVVKVESGFRPSAESSKGALGYTQIRLRTARQFDSTLTAQDLFDRETNLRLGFRFLKQLLGRFDGNLRLALLAYNRGPTRVEEIVGSGGDPANGYSESILKGIRQARAGGRSRS